MHIAPDLGSPARRGKSRILVVFKAFCNVADGPKHKQDEQVIFARLLNAQPSFQLDGGVIHRDSLHCRAGKADSIGRG